MAGKGRPSKYESHVKPHLAEIEEMASYMTEKQIAEALQISYSTFRVYKTHFTALRNSLKKGRFEVVKTARSNLIKRGTGFQYEERKKIIEDGEVVREEVYTKAALPDVAAINLILKNYDADNWANDPKLLELKQEELKLKKLQFEKESW